MAGDGLCVCGGGGEMVGRCRSVCGCFVPPNQGVRQGSQLVTAALAIVVLCIVHIVGDSRGRLVHRYRKAHGSGTYGTVCGYCNDEPVCTVRVETWACKCQQLGSPSLSLPIQPA
jgi:hypothetical protein